MLFLLLIVIYLSLFIYFFPSLLHWTTAFSSKWFGGFLKNVPPIFRVLFVHRKTFSLRSSVRPSEIAILFWIVSGFWACFIYLYVQEELAFGLVFSVLFQELFRLGIYILLKKADIYLRWKRHSLYSYQGREFVIFTQFLSLSLSLSLLLNQGGTFK